MNLVTLEFVKSRGLEVGSIQDLNNHNGYIPLSRLGGRIMEPLGYVILWVQIPYVPSYNEDQVALVVQEDSNFLKKCQVIIGTPTINRAVRAMKESEMDSAPEAWQSALHTYEFANYAVQLDPEDYSMALPTNTGENLTDLDELVLLKNKVTIPAFESSILHCCTHRMMMMGYKLHVMTQATYPEDRANLPNGVYVVKTYTELHDGSRNVSVVLRNLMGKPVHLPAGRPVGWVVAANAIPDATPSLEFIKKLDEMEPDQNPWRKLTIEERQKLLLELLWKEGQLDKRKKWPAHIGSIIIAYNSTRSLVTGYSPYYLMFGRRPRLPIDLLFPMHRTQMLTHTIDEYVASLYDRLRKSLVIMQDCAVKEAQRQKQLYDRKVGAVELRPGDNVLV